MLALALAAFLLYLPGLWWGLPHPVSVENIHGWDMDSVAGMQTLSELHNLLVQPRPGWWVAYPPFHYLLLGAAYAPYLGWLFVTGAFSHPSSVFPYGFADPAGSIAMLALIGRTVSLFMGCGVVLAAYATARDLWDQRTAVLAAIALLLCSPMAYYSRTGNLDIPAMFWTSLAVWMIVRSLTAGLTLRRGLILGIVAALAVSTKDQSYGALLPGIGVLFFVRRRQLKALIITGATGTLAYALGSGLLFWPSRFRAHLHFVTDFRHTFPNVVNLGVMRAPTPAGYGQLGIDILVCLLEAIGPILLGFAVTQVVLCVRQWLRGTGDPGRNWATVSLLAMALGHVLLVMVPIRHMQYRYILFSAFIASLFAGRALARALSLPDWRRTAAFALGATGFMVNAALGADLTYQMLVDARQPAAEWFRQAARPGDKLAYFGDICQLFTLPDGAQAVAMPLETTQIYKALARGDFRFVMVAPDYTSRSMGAYAGLLHRGLDHSRFLPAPILAGLRDGSLGYRRAAFFSASSLLGRPTPYMPWVNPPVEMFEKCAASGDSGPCAGSGISPNLQRGGPR